MSKHDDKLYMMYENDLLAEVLRLRNAIRKHRDLKVTSGVG